MMFGRINCASQLVYLARRCNNMKWQTWNLHRIHDIVYWSSNLTEHTFSRSRWRWWRTRNIFCDPARNKRVIVRFQDMLCHFNGWTKYNFQSNWFKRACWNVYTNFLHFVCSPSISIAALFFSSDSSNFFLWTIYQILILVFQLQRPISLHIKIKHCIF